MKKYCLLLFFLLIIVPLKAQFESLPPDSLIVGKSWIDENGENNLWLKIYAVYNPYNPKMSDDGGYPTKIEARLRNIRYNLSVSYDDDDFQMEVIMFNEAAIWFHEINGIQAVFIPFFYCCMANSPTKVSYIIFYNNKKYLYHFGFLCEDLNFDCDCVLQESDKDLNKKLKKMPKELRSIFIEYIENKYKTLRDVFPIIIVEDQNNLSSDH